MKVTLPLFEDDGATVLALADGSWGDPHGARLVHLTDEQFAELCSGAEFHQLEGDLDVLAQIETGPA